MLSALVDQQGLPLACLIALANIHDSQLYEPTMDAFEIPGTAEKPSIITADTAYDSHEIRRYNRKRRIRSNIPINPRNRTSPKRGRPVLFNRDLYKKRSAIERFFSWIEAFKKLIPRYERYEQSFLGLIHLACAVTIWRVLGRPHENETPSLRELLFSLVCEPSVHGWLQSGELCVSAYSVPGCTNEECGIGSAPGSPGGWEERAEGDWHPS